MKKKIEELYFVTSNKGKAGEAQEILQFPIKIIELDLDEIQSLDLEKIIKKKAKEAYKILKKPLIVDDVGLFASAWDGFPGPFIKYILNGKNDLLLKMMAREENRDVTITCTIGFHDGKKVHMFTGNVLCQITHMERGKGWGWDPVLVPDGFDRTFAEMGREEKNKISHRRQALDIFRTFLVENGYIDN